MAGTPAIKIDDGLVIHCHAPVIGERGAHHSQRIQLVRQLGLVHLVCGTVKADAVATALACKMQRKIGAIEQFVDFHRSICTCAAGNQRQAECIGIEHDFFCFRSFHDRCRRAFRLQMRDGAQVHGELVAADSSNEVRGPDFLRQCLGSQLQNTIAGGAAITVVDRTQAANLQQHDRSALGSGRRCMYARLQQVNKLILVHQAGQCIVFDRLHGAQSRCRLLAKFDQRILDGIAQGFEAQRLGQIAVCAVLQRCDGMFGIVIVGRHDEQWRTGLHARGFQQRQAAHAGHRDIAQHQVDRLFDHALQCIFSADRGRDGKAEPLQHRLAGEALNRSIINHQRM